MEKSVISVVLPPNLWSRVRASMCAARTGNEEVLGFLFCTRHQVRTGHLRLLPRVWAVPGRDCYDLQSVGGLRLNQQVHYYLLKQYVDAGLDVVHLHTHPGSATPRFSATDDAAEAEYVRFLSRFPWQPLLVSGVFDQAMHKGTYRVWHTPETPNEGAVVFQRDVLPERALRTSSALGEVFDRQRVFGKQFQQRLAGLTVGLIGCGGIGSVFAEQLARLGVYRWTLVDDDVIESTNLNRLPFTGHEHIGLSKVRYVRAVIRRLWKDKAKVTTCRMRVDDPQAQQRLAQCDILVAATDNHSSRVLAQELALRYVRPLVNLGTYIEAPEGGKPPRMLARVTMPPLAGQWCLCCGGIVNTRLAAVEHADPQVQQQVREAGYLQDVAAPAVYWLNSLCASLGVFVIHNLVSDMVDLQQGLDMVADFPGRRLLTVDHPDDNDCYFCAPDGYFALGGLQDPRLQEAAETMPELVL